MRELLKQLIQSGRLNDFDGDEAQLPWLLLGIDFIRKGALAAGIRQLKSMKHWGLAEIELARDTIPFWNALNAAAEDYLGSFGKPFSNGALAFLWGTLLGPYAGVVFNFYDQAPQFCVRVVGVGYDAREILLNRLKPDDPVTLLWEPGNPYDPYAVGVFDVSGQSLGYIRSTISGSIVKRLQRGDLFTARVKAILGPGYDINERLNVEVAIQGKRKDCFFQSGIMFEESGYGKDAGGFSLKQTCPTLGDGDGKIEYRKGGE